VVVSLLILSLFYFRRIGESEVIVKIGSISFVAMAQLLPAMIGGMFWKKGTLKGAFTAILVGMSVWFYTSMLPSIIRSDWIDTNILQEGLFQLVWLKPEQLFGSTITTAVGHSMFWSLLANLGIYILVSSLGKNTDSDELKHNQNFINVGRGKTQNSQRLTSSLTRDIALDLKLKKIDNLLAEYLSDHERDEKISLCITRSNLERTPYINILELAKLKAQSTSILAGIIGMATANKVIKTIELIDKNEQILLSSCYSDLLVKAQLSPDDLLEKIDFHQEKQYLLENHAEQQQFTIQKLQDEQEQTSQAKLALKLLNEDLEQRVGERTEQLTQANDDLTDAMFALKNTQTQLVEAEKMASLGGLVAGISHEINTPIGIVLTAVSSLQAETKNINYLYQESKITKKSMEHYLKYAKEACTISENNIRRAVDLVASFKQVAVDQTHEEKRSFLVKEYIDDILLSLRPTLRKTQLSVDVHCDDQLQINSFPGAFSQILSNLIINSLIHAYVPDQQGRISINITKTEDMLEFLYSDDGIGISPQGKLNIFEPFYTTKRGSGGTGLGAHIIYNIVTQQLKGEIVLDDSIEKGLGFIIKLPLTY
jgi:signal transduction histidine kinase